MLAVSLALGLAAALAIYFGMEFQNQQREKGIIYFSAARHGHLDNLMGLLKGGVNIDLHDSDGRSA